MIPHRRETFRTLFHFFVKSRQLFRLDGVGASQLPDGQLAVQITIHFLLRYVEGVVQGQQQSAVLRLVVGALTDVAKILQKFFVAFVVNKRTDPGVARIAARRAVGVRDHVTHSLGRSVPGRQFFLQRVVHVVQVRRRSGL